MSIKNMTIIFIVLVSIVFADSNKTIPVYIFKNKDHNHHFHDISMEQKKKWKDQGIDFWAYSDSIGGTIPVYRFQNKNHKHHIYSTNINQKKIGNIKELIFGFIQNQLV